MGLASLERKTHLSRFPDARLSVRRPGGQCCTARPAGWRALRRARRSAKRIAGQGSGRRRGRDSNPRPTFRQVRDFQSRSFGHSDTSPSAQRLTSRSSSAWESELGAAARSSLCSCSSSAGWLLLRGRTRSTFGLLDGLLVRPAARAIHAQQVHPSQGGGVHVQHASLRRRNGLHRLREHADPRRGASRRDTCRRLRQQNAAGAGRSERSGAAARRDRRRVPLSSSARRLLRVRRGANRGPRGDGCGGRGPARGILGTRPSSASFRPRPHPDYDRYPTSSSRSARRRSSTTTTRFSWTETTEPGLRQPPVGPARRVEAHRTPFWFFAQLTQLPGLRRARSAESGGRRCRRGPLQSRRQVFTYWSNVSDEADQDGERRQERRRDPRRNRPAAPDGGDGGAHRR